MYCSVKFLSPIVTAGLPLPGWSELDELPPELLLPLSSEPHAASPRQAASSTARMRGCRLTGVSLSGGGFGLQGGVVDAGAQPAGGHQPLEAGEDEVDEQGEDRDADRCPQHAGQVVARLVDDDVAQATLGADQRPERDGGDDVDRRGADRGEEQWHRERQ